MRAKQNSYESWLWWKRDLTNINISISFIRSKSSSLQLSLSPLWYTHFQLISIMYLHSISPGKSALWRRLPAWLSSRMLQLWPPCQPVHHRSLYLPGVLCHNEAPQKGSVWPHLSLRHHSKLWVARRWWWCHSRRCCSNKHWHSNRPCCPMVAPSTLGCCSSNRCWECPLVAWCSLSPCRWYHLLRGPTSEWLSR